MATHRSSTLRVALGGFTALVLLASSCGGDDDTSSGATTVAAGDGATGDATASSTTPADAASGAATPSDTAPGATTAADSTTPAATAPAADSSTSCFGITMADILGTIGDSVTTRYETELIPPGDSSGSSSCFTDLDLPATSSFGEAMSISFRVEVFDPQRHTLDGLPADYATLRANNVECCSVVDLSGLGEEAFRWTSSDVDSQRSTAVLFRQGELVGAVFFRVRTNSDNDYANWATSLPAVEGWALTLAGLVAADGLDRSELPPAAAPLPAPTTAAP